MVSDKERKKKAKRKTSQNVIIELFLSRRFMPWKKYTQGDPREEF